MEIIGSESDVTNTINKLMAAHNATLQQSDDTKREAIDAGKDLIEWIRVKLSEAESSLSAREQVVETFLSGTDEEWSEAAKLHPLTAGNPMTKLQRSRQAEIQRNIAAKCKHDVEMFKAVLTLAAHPAPDGGQEKWTVETVRNLLCALDGYSDDERYQVVADAHNATLQPQQQFFCNKCGYSGDQKEHTGCNYNAQVVQQQSDDTKRWDWAEAHVKDLRAILNHPFEIPTTLREAVDVEMRKDIRLAI